MQKHLCYSEEFKIFFNGELSQKKKNTKHCNKHFIKPGVSFFQIIDVWTVCKTQKEDTWLVHHSQP